MMLKSYLDNLYLKYNKKEFISPDPLEFVYHYSMDKDIESFAFIASALAFGRVSQILKALSEIELIFNGSPFSYIQKSSLSKMQKDFKNFKYRMINSQHFTTLLFSLKLLYKEYKSIENVVYEGYRIGSSLHDGLVLLYDKLKQNIKGNGFGLLLANPTKTSPCKRLYLFLRWMLRKDEVDLGIWSKIDKKELIIPLDTHMLAVAKSFGIGSKKLHIKTAIELTKIFSIISPDDPVKYDFTLTRFGIREMQELEMLTKLGSLRSVLPRNI